jgi:threonylcarbamoyladenosine tRNA methylthiotransferase MtaB
LLERGLTVAGAPIDAEVVVLNTCTVTASADQDVRATIRRIHRQNPSCKILVTGCYAQRAPDELAAIPGVSVVVGNSHKQHVAEIALGRVGNCALVPLTDLRRPDVAATAGEDASAAKPEADIYVGDIFAHTELAAATPASAA